MSIASGEGLIFPIFSKSFHETKVPLSNNGIPSRMNVNITGCASFTASQKSVSSHTWGSSLFFTPAIAEASATNW